MLDCKHCSLHLRQQTPPSRKFQAKPCSPPQFRLHRSARFANKLKTNPEAQMRQIYPPLAALLLAGCVMPNPYGALPQPTIPQPTASLPAPQSGPLAPRDAATNFLTVVKRVEPVAEAYCRAQATTQNCDLQIVIDDRPGQSANAFQTLDNAGRPIIAFNLALIADARTPDEIAFILGHEAGHHIAGHIPRQKQSAQTGAILAAILANATGAGQAQSEQLQQLGAGLAAQRYSKDYELQADAIGTEIAFDAGYDPILGAAFFDRLPDPGDEFLGSHPGNAQRKAVVAQTMARLRGN
jgi:Zn-dependent protease with chaperone function